MCSAGHLMYVGHWHQHRRRHRLIPSNSPQCFTLRLLVERGLGQGRATSCSRQGAGPSRLEFKIGALNLSKSPPIEIQIFGAKISQTKKKIKKKCGRLLIASCPVALDENPVTCLIKKKQESDMHIYAAQRKIVLYLVCSCCCWIDDTPHLRRLASCSLNFSLAELTEWVWVCVCVCKTLVETTHTHTAGLAAALRM